MSINGISRQDTTLIEYGRTESEKRLTWTDIQRSAQLFLLNLEPTLAPLQTTMPNVISVGGLTCKPAKPLPQNIKEIVEMAQHGIVLFSFGSFADHLPAELNQKLVSAFGQVKETVILKFRGTVNFPVPSNVKLLKWIHQNDILGHPKTKLFITHSGNNGQYEALFHAVPMLAFYMFGDQEHSARRVQQKGFGKLMSIKHFTRDELVENMYAILKNDVFSRTIKAASLIHRLHKHRLSTAMLICVTTP